MAPSPFILGRKAMGTLEVKVHSNELENGNGRTMPFFPSVLGFAFRGLSCSNFQALGFRVLGYNLGRIHGNVRHNRFGHGSYLVARSWGTTFCVGASLNLPPFFRINCTDPPERPCNGACRGLLCARVVPWKKNSPRASIDC